MVNRDDLIAYLLHEMPDSRREEFAERWFADPRLHRRLRMVEGELLDRYARGQVSAERRERIERYLLDSETQRDKLAFAHMLQAELRSRRRRLTRWPAIAAAAVILLLLGAALWLGLRNFALRQELARISHDVRPVAAEVYAVPLSDTLRGSLAETTVRLPAGATLVRFELELEPHEERAGYSATLSSTGRTVWAQGPFDAEQRERILLAPVWVPAKILSAGQYVVKLEARGRTVAYYPFAIEK